MTKLLKKKQRQTGGGLLAALTRERRLHDSDLNAAHERVAALEVRVRADDAALEFAVTKAAELREEMTRLRRNFERLEMHWHDEHDHALEFATDILATCGVGGPAEGNWLCLRTYAHRQAAQFLAKRSLVEINPTEDHLVRFIAATPHKITRPTDP